MKARILHLSDPHFGTEVPAVLRALEAAVTSLAPSHLVLSGDVTQRALKPEFQAARAFLDRLAVPRSLVLPGNHDVPLFALWERALTPYRRYRRHLQEPLSACLDDESTLLLGLDTTRRWRHVDGEVSREQIEETAKRLQHARPAQLRVVVTHQPAWVQREVDRKDLLHGHRHALRRWAEAGCDLVLGGHVHLPFLAPVHESLDLARPLWVLQAGTACSARVRPEAPHSFNLIDYGIEPSSNEARRTARVERWDLVGTEFDCVRSDLLVLP